jgi:hypothetical protein
MNRTYWGLLTGGLALGALLVCATALAADEEARGALTWRDPRPGALHVGLQVLVDSQPLATVAHAGKTYLPVPRWGTEYAIRVSNHGPRRVLAVLSVDGLSVINGRPASAESTGYVVAPSSQIVIRGWRRSLSTVAAFTFEPRAKSYAGLMGWPENVGVIGLLAIEEQAPRPRLGLERGAGAAPTAAKALAAGVGGTGTGYGRDLDAPAYYVPFARGPNRRAVTFYYDTADALRRAGVPVDAPHPLPFPGDSEFAPPPSGRAGP